MRIMLAVIISALPLLVTFGVTKYSENRGEKINIENLYADCGVIMDDPGIVGDTVTVTMQNGNMFAFENQDGDWNYGDLVSILFDNNGTEKVYDDIILDYKYAGWISETEIENWIKYPN